VVELVLLCELTEPLGLVVLLLELELGLAALSLEGAVELGVDGDALGEAEAPLWSVDDELLFIEPVALLWPVVPVELVVPTWFWSLGVVVVVVVVVLPLGFDWLCDIVVELLLGAVPD